MPRRLTADAAVEAEAKSWVRSLIRTEMARRGLTYRDLAEQLAAIGIEENERNIANKVARGELSAATFLLCLKGMGCDSVSLSDTALAVGNRARDDLATIDQALESQLITVVERDDTAGTYRIKVGALSTPITILLSQLETRVRPTLSHMIVPPGRKPLGIHIPTVFHSAQLALARIVKLLVDAYETGIEAGNTPDESWLIPMNSLMGAQLNQKHQGPRTRKI